MKWPLALLVVLAPLLFCGMARAESITLDHVDGLIGPTNLATGQEIVFHMRFSSPNAGHKGLTNGWRVYSPTANWDTTKIALTGTLTNIMFDLFLGIQPNPQTADGIGSDTVGIAAAVLFGPGMPQGFNDIVATITIGPIDPLYSGQTLCLDSAFYRPSGIWKWAGPEAYPSWDGPHCYTIGTPPPVPEIECPSVPFAETTCGAQQICEPLTITGATQVTADNGASWSGGQLCFTPTGPGVYTIRVIATNSAGADTCDVTIDVTFVEPPVIVCPEGPIMRDVCMPGEQVCIPLPITGADQVVSTTGTWSSGQLCFTAIESGMIPIEVTATNCAGSDVCEFSVHIHIDQAPIVTINDPGGFTTCVPHEICFSYTASDADEDPMVERLASGPGAIDTLNNRVCFTPTTTGDYRFIVTATDPCGAVGADTVTVPVIFDPPFVLQCPETPVHLNLCEPGNVCIGITVSGYTELNVSYGTFDPGTSQVCFYADTAGTYIVDVDAFGPCGEGNCQVTAIVSMGQPPVIVCPEGTIHRTLCDPGNVCIELPIRGFDNLNLPDGATWSNDTLCFYAASSGVYNMTVTATSGCGSAVCDISADITVVPAPTIACPDGPITVLASQDPVCIPMTITNYDQVFVYTVEKSIWLPTWSNDTLCFDASVPGTYYASVVATNRCDTTTCNIEVIVTNCQEVHISCPTDTVEITLCTMNEPCLLCFGLPITGASNVEVTGNASEIHWDNDSLCFWATTWGIYNFHVTAYGGGEGCPVDECDITVLVKKYVWECSDMLLSQDTFYFSMGALDVENPAPQTLHVGTSHKPFCFVFAQAGGFTWLTVPDNGCTGQPMTIQVDGMNLSPGVYTTEVAVIGNSFEVCEPSTHYFTVRFEILPPHSDEDIIAVPTVPGVPGSKVAVPIGIEHVCDLASVQATFNYLPVYFTLDSFSWAGSSIASWTNKSVVVDGGLMTVTGEYDGDLMIEPGIGTLVTFWFTVDRSTPAGFYPMTADNAQFEVACYGTPITEPVIPTVIPGGFVVGTPENYVCGYIVDPDMNPIEGATVQLWAQFPFGSPDAVTHSDATGLFEFFNSTVVPFDLHAYKDGYYPATVENIEWGETGIIIVLTPIERPYVTDMWVNFYCAENTYRGEPIPVGSVIDAYDPDGVHCGTFTVREPGVYGFMPVYRDDPWTATDEGAEVGDIIRFFVDGIEAYPSVTPIWSGNGNAEQVCLSVGDIVEHQCDLVKGWNLISWNVNTDVDDIEQVLAPIADKIEVVLGFDHGGLTYDPDFPLFSNLHKMDHLSGYWIKVKDAVTLTVEGAPVPATTAIALDPGWNLVSYLPDFALETPTALASVADHLDVALGYDQGYKVYVPGDDLHNDLTAMNSCHGYWLRVDRPLDLVYPGAGPKILAPRAGSGLIAAKTAGDIPTTLNWVNLYAAHLTLDGEVVPAGTTVTAHAADGRIIGSFTLAQDGLFGFMPVYGDDQTTDVKEAVTPGETFTLRVGGTETNESFTWTENYDRIEVGALTAKTQSSTDPMPTQFELQQNYPNPFNPSTTIGFSLPKAGEARLEIYNILGRLVATPFDGMANAGYNEVNWNGRDDAGHEVASGIYFYRLTSATFTDTKKMTLVK